jgi:hypothetical protein
MKTCAILMTASLLALGTAACSPSTPANEASDSASFSASGTETVAAATPEAADAVTDDVAVAPSTPAESAAASSVTTVIVEQTGAYDPAVVDEMGRKPGYWEVRHTDPATHKIVTQKVCIDRTTGAQMTRDGGHVARRDVQASASWLGACPSTVRAGEVVRADGHKVDAWNGHHPQPAPRADDRSGAYHDGAPHDAPQDGDVHDHNDQGHANDHQPDDHGAKPADAHAPHATPAEAHGDSPTQHKAHDDRSSASRSQDRR